MPTIDSAKLKELSIIRPRWVRIKPAPRFRFHQYTLFELGLDNRLHPKVPICGGIVGRKAWIQHTRLFTLPTSAVSASRCPRYGAKPMANVWYECILCGPDAVLEAVSRAAVSVSQFRVDAAF